MELSEQQEYAVASAIAAIETGQRRYTIGGAAGTGKSTIMQAIIGESRDIGVCAFAGKAASVLRKKGVKNATTIHKKIYNWNGRVFKKRDKVSWRAFAVDEGSMVGTRIFDDLQSYNIPIIVIGDHYQLEPVGDGSINLMHDLDVELTEVFRHQNEILDRATAIREDFEWTKDFGTKALGPMLKDFDVIICPFNKQRVAINKKYRGTDDPTPKVGDRIICLRNDYNRHMFNGQIFEALETEMVGKYAYATLKDDEGDVRESVKIGMKSFYSQTPESFDYDQDYMIADYAYGITAHKAQGSEWDNVAVLYSPCKHWDNQRWLYTAVTRASKTLKVFA